MNRGNLELEKRRPALLEQQRKSRSAWPSWSGQSKRGRSGSARSRSAKDSWSWKSARETRELERQREEEGRRKEIERRGGERPEAILPLTQGALLESFKCQ